ncbi:hypothetical protein EV714DRAFT_234141 [Schizophyllum commune]
MYYVWKWHNVLYPAGVSALRLAQGSTSPTSEVGAPPTPEVGAPPTSEVGVWFTPRHRWTPARSARQPPKRPAPDVTDSAPAPDVTVSASASSIVDSAIAMNTPHRVFAIEDSAIAPAEGQQEYVGRRGPKAVGAGRGVRAAQKTLYFEQRAGCATRVVHKTRYFNQSTRCVTSSSAQDVSLQSGYKTRYFATPQARHIISAIEQDAPSRAAGTIEGRRHHGGQDATRGAAARIIRRQRDASSCERDATSCERDASSCERDASSFGGDIALSSTEGRRRVSERSDVAFLKDQTSRFFRRGVSE